MKMEKKLKIRLEKKKAMLNFMVNFGSKTKSAITNPYFYILNFQKMKSCILTFEHPKMQCGTVQYYNNNIDNNRKATTSQNGRQTDSQ